MISQYPENAVLRAPYYEGIALKPLDCPIAWTFRYRHLTLWHYRKMPKGLPGRRMSLYRIDDSSVASTGYVTRQTFLARLAEILTCSQPPVRLPTDVWEAMIRSAEESKGGVEA